MFSAVIFYGGTGIMMFVHGKDYWYGYYSMFLAFFSGLYHYYDEKRYFAEDFICSFFLKLHIFLNYVVWVGWQKFLYYSMIVEFLGFSLFYLSFLSWKYKQQNYGYMIVHNIWHLYTGVLAYFVVIKEERYELGYWDNIFMMLFVICMTNYNLKNRLYVRGIIFGSFYLWNIGNFYNFLSLGILHLIYLMGKKFVL